MLRCGLRPTERPCDEIQDELGDPCPARATEIGNVSTGLKVLNRHCKIGGYRMGGSLAWEANDFKSEIVGEKPKTNNLSRECDLIGPGDHIIPWIPPK